MLLGLAISGQGKSVCKKTYMNRNRELRRTYAVYSKGAIRDKARQVCQGQVKKCDMLSDFGK